MLPRIDPRWSSICSKWSAIRGTKRGGGRLQCTLVVGRELASATHRMQQKLQNCCTFCLCGQTIALLFFFTEMRPGPQWEAGLPGVQGNDFPKSAEERSSSPGGARTGKKYTDVQSCRLKSNNHILVLFNADPFSLNIWFMNNPILCFRLGWKGDESQLVRKRRRCQRTRRRRRRRKKAQKRRNKYAGS